MSQAADVRTMLILGAGYSGKAIARLLAEKGWRIKGTSRSESGAAALSEAGIEGHVVRDGGLAPEILEGIDALLACAPPDDSGDPFVARLEALPKERFGRLRWIGYLSTTGVYGDTAGAWVDETAPPNPSNQRGRRRVMAERQWLELGRRLGIAVQVFRLPGIYGPGRSALDDVRAGKARRIVKPGQAFSRIHVDDIAGAVAASLERPDPGAIYNVADDLPAPSAEVVAFACELLGLAPPAPIAFDEIAPTLSPMAREFYADNRRIANDRIKRELGMSLRYPDYRAGLRAILSQQR